MAGYHSQNHKMKQDNTCVRFVTGSILLRPNIIGPACLSIGNTVESSGEDPGPPVGSNDVGPAGSGTFLTGSGSYPLPLIY